jgi:hypothetical protein
MGLGLCFYFFAFSPIGVQVRIAISTERNPHLVASFPDDTACQLQTIILDDQVEAFCKRKDVHRLRKLDRCASSRNVAHRAWIFVAAVLSDGSLIYSIARGDPSFDHDEINLAQCRGGCPSGGKYSIPWGAERRRATARRSLRCVTRGIRLVEVLLIGRYSGSLRPEITYGRRLRRGGGDRSKRGSIVTEQIDVALQLGRGIDRCSDGGVLMALKDGLRLPLRCGVASNAPAYRQSAPIGSANLLRPPRRRFRKS